MILMWGFPIENVKIICADPEGGGGGGGIGVRNLMKNHKNIGFISNTGPEP